MDAAHITLGLHERRDGRVPCSAFLCPVVVLFARWWGHKAEKPTLLYIAGCEPRDVPGIGKSECVIRLDKRRPDGTHIRKGDKDYRPALGPEEREATPPAFARWLVELARRTNQGHNNPDHAQKCSDIPPGERNPTI